MKGNRPESVVEALEEVVEWFYVLDSIAQKIAMQRGTDYEPGNQMQIDVARLAEWFKANPEQAEAAWSSVLAYKPPTLQDLLGIAGPEFTGGLCSVCFVKMQRGYEPAELPHGECAEMASLQ